MNMLGTHRLAVIPHMASWRKSSHFSMFSPPSLDRIDGGSFFERGLTGIFSHLSLPFVEDF